MGKGVVGGAVGVGVVRHAAISIHGMDSQHSSPVGYNASHAGAHPWHGLGPQQLWTHLGAEGGASSWDGG